jgi:hypothetical protein
VAVAAHIPLQRLTVGCQEKIIFDKKKKLALSSPISERALGCIVQKGAGE